MLKRLFGDPNARVVRSLQPMIEKINALEPRFAGMDAVALRGVSAEFRGRLAAPRRDSGQGGATLDDILPEAFAACRVAAQRTLNQRHFDVQCIGAIVLHRGQIAEMKTGEGKTLTATLAVYLNALAGNGVHVVTVNDYLARRDAAWMGQVYDALGLTVGCLNHEQAYMYDPEVKSKKLEVKSADDADTARDATGAYKVAYDFLRPVSRKEAYACDITYGTNNEYGFDYLRDNMAMRSEDRVQSRHPADGSRDPDTLSSGRGHAYAIVDEIDSILIDEARTPLIISAPAEESGEEYRRFADLVRKLEREKHYAVDEKQRATTLTEEGIVHVEALLGVGNIYAQGTKLVHHLEQALRAEVLYHRDTEYVVRDGEVIIVDEFTGRLMHGRRYSEGLHQAIEAKEGVAIQRESQTLATITFQNYFRQYAKLAGMTGTAATEAEEFAKIYGLEVVSVPTHRPMVRQDARDRIYRTEEAKLRAVVEEVRAAHERGQPVLLGTISIEKNERLHALLSAAGIPHEMLNAKQHEREGEIIAQAGRPGAVTLATNMAGRGVDIILGGNPPDAGAQASVKEHGGLLVIGTERHESRRIDNQLRGRAGRQGDPGASVFFIALDDDLMRIFGGERLQRILVRLNVPDDVPIENAVISKQIEAAQRKVESHHFDSRKHLLDYDDVLNKHRDVVYRRRRAALDATDPDALIQPTLEAACERIVSAHTSGEDPAAWDLVTLQQSAVAAGFSPPSATVAAGLEISNLSSKGGSASGGKSQIKNSGDKLSTIERRHALVEQLVAAGTQRLTELRAGLSPSSRGQSSQQATPTAWRRAGRDGRGDVESARPPSPVGGGVPVSDPFPHIVRAVTLRAIDQLWIEHLEAIEHLRQGIGLRGYGQRDPLIEYKREAYRLFTELLALMEHDTIRTLMHVAPAAAQVESVFAKRGIQLSGAAKTMERGSSVAAGSVPRRMTGVSPPSASEPSAHGELKLAATARVPKRLADATPIAEPSAQTPHIGRNDPCPCGSGKKYKKCHGA